jgi:type IV fimbrial biogenesis protein FimT
VEIHPYFFGSQKTGARGFTLVELLVTLSVLAVLLAIAVPSFQGTITSSQLTSRTNELVSALNLARSEAIRRGARVTLCKSSSGTACIDTGNWEQGWIAFVDTTRSGTSASVDSGETVLLVQQAVSGTTVIKGSTNLVNYVSFGADGRPRTLAGTFTSGTLRACSTSAALTNSNRARDVELSTVGRLSTSTPTTVASSCPAP